jgi:hypothetical protein
VTLTRLQALAHQSQTGQPMEAAFLMGRMAEKHVAAGAQGRNDFEKYHPKLRKQWKRLRRRLDQLNTQAHEPSETMLAPAPK